MDALEKTDSLERKDIAVTLLDKSPWNPNKMTQREFDLLVDNFQVTGFTDPLLVRPNKKGRYRIVGGHHRFDAAVYLGFKKVPCTIITDPAFDEEAEQFQMVRMNLIRGRMDPQKFFDLYSSVAGKYSDAILQEMFGFAEQAQFEALIKQTADSIQDPVLKEKFKEGAKEVKTIDGLAKLLNEIFTKYGDSLPYGFIVFDYGGQRSVWVETSAKTMKAFDVVGEICREQGRTIDDIVGYLVQIIAQGKAKELVAEAVKASKPVVLPKGLQTLPTKENLKALEAAA
jgi:hypothetical protein